MEVFGRPHVYENLGRRTLPPSQIAAHVWPAFLSGGGRNRGRGQSAFPRRRSREAISAVCTARSGVTCRNALFGRRRLRTRGARCSDGGTAGESPPGVGIGYGRRPHGKTPRLGPKSDLSTPRRSPSESIAVSGAGPGTRTLLSQARAFPIGICLPARGSVEIARRRENPLPPRYRTRLPGPIAPPRRSILCASPNPARAPVTFVP